MSRLAELLFVAVLRGALAQDLGAGWLGAMADPQLCRALTAVQREPARGWTAASLGRVAGLSRSAFFARFTAVVGEPPSAWLTRWRMHVARGALPAPPLPAPPTGPLPMAEIDLVALHEATRRRYLNYALSVITARALPDVRDGLKPVQRRILTAIYVTSGSRPTAATARAPRWWAT